MATDGTYWFYYSKDRGLQRARKEAATGKLEREEVCSPGDLLAVQLLCHKGLLLVRHKGAPTAPFEVFDKETLRPVPGRRIRLAEGSDDPTLTLNWTPIQTRFEKNPARGNRWVLSTPMCSDGSYIYFLLQYKEALLASKVVRTVCEVYHLDEDDELHRTKEIVLYKDARMQCFKGRHKVVDREYLMRGSLACNGKVLVWHSRSKVHVFSLETGIRIKKMKVSESELLSSYDPADNYFYHTSHQKANFGLFRLRL